MAWSVQDLGEITHLLISQLRDAIKAAIQASPSHMSIGSQIEVSGLMPAVSRNDGTPVLSLYLLHVARDPYWRNTPVQGQRAQLNASQPLSLNLSYLLTSYSEKHWHLEQYMMSVALAYFHANPINIINTPTLKAEFTVTVEADSIEEMSRLWQAITVPIRLSSMFRVAVVFLTPETPPQEQVRTPVEVSLSVSADLNAADPVPEPEPQLFELARQIAFSASPDATDTAQVSTQPGQAPIAAGDSVLILGSGMDQPNGAAVYLRPSGGGSEWPITNWRVFGTSASGAAGNADQLVLRFPQTYGALPASGVALIDTPPPGTYVLTVGNATAAFRSNALTLSIAPIETGIGPTAPLLAPNASGVYTLNAGGLIAGETQVWLNQIELTVATTVAPGVATVNAGTGVIEFELPASGFTAGGYAQVRLITNSIEAPPGWWVQIPWPLLTPDTSGVYTLTANGLVAGATSVLLNQTALTIATAVAPGSATVNAINGLVQFALPATGLTSGSYAQVGVVVNAVPLPPGWWVRVP
jgi:hypothetical protein